MPGCSFYRRPELCAQQTSFCYCKLDEMPEEAERLRKLRQFSFFLKPALEAPPQVKRERKIFSVLTWINAFICGQQSGQALDQVREFLRMNLIDRDLELKVLEVVDELERTERIRAKIRFGKMKSGRQHLRSIHRMRLHFSKPRIAELPDTI